MDRLKVMYSSKTDLWATPQNLFDDLNQEFKFTLDPCATETNAKCHKFYTIEQDGLKQNWGGIIYSVTHLMGKLSGGGCRNAAKNQRNPTPEW